MPGLQHKNVGLVTLSDKVRRPDRHLDVGMDVTVANAVSWPTHSLELPVALNTLHLCVAAALATSTVDARIFKVDGSCQPMPPGAFG
jgi:hypothetical protein